MKTCPKCGKNYTDSTLNFCLEDGTPLSQFGGAQPIPDTVLINQASPVSENAPFGNQHNQSNWGVSPTSVVNTPKKKSNAIFWVLGILGGAILLCGGSFAGLIFLGSLSDDNQQWNANFGTNSTYNVTTSNSNVVTNTERDSTGTKKPNLSAWVQKDSKYGTTVMQGDEFLMSAAKSNSYYVLVASTQYRSGGASTKVTLREVASGNNILGYGLIINSNPVPLIKDHAFLINARNSKYRIVTHSPGTEKVLVNWKSSKSINSGDAENTLEVKDQGGEFKFYINGDLVETLSSTESYTSGVAGLYVGGTSPIAFSNLEITK